MNTLRIYSVRDLKAECFTSIFTFKTDAEAIRAFGDSAKSNQTLLGQHPEDFQLCKVGFFNLNDGSIQPCAPIALAVASDFVNKE